MPKIIHCNHLLVLITLTILVTVNPCLSQSSVCNFARNADCNNNGNSPDNPGCNICNNNVCGQCLGQNSPNGFFKVSNHLDHCIPCSNILGCSHCADNNGCQQCIDTLIQPTDIYNCGIKICYPDSDTPDPTDSPTPVPTDNPSNAPTVAPSNSPTIAPSGTPTSAPVELPPAEIFREIFESLFQTLTPSFARYREDAIIVHPWAEGGVEVWFYYFANVCDISVHSHRNEFLFITNDYYNNVTSAVSYVARNSCHSSINGFFWINARTSVEYDENGLIKRQIVYFLEETDFDYIISYGEERIAQGVTGYTFD